MVGYGWLPTLALVGFVPLALIAAGMVRPPVAAISILLAGLLFLPEIVALDIRGFPPLGKWEVASLSALLACVLWYPRALFRARPGRGVDLFLALMMLGGIATAVTNADSLSYGPRLIRGLSLYDAFSMALRDLLRFASPFLLGRALFRSPRDLRTLLVAFVVAALAYSLLVLIEVRLSPQFHRWVYGFHQHSFSQTMRFGGFRPMVFLFGGLPVALLYSAACIACTVLVQSRVGILGMPGSPAALYLGGILLLCKSFAAISYALVAVPAVVLLRPARQTQFAVLLALGVMLFPVMRSQGLFPTRTLVAAAAELNETRASSLRFRFDNEDQLLAKANERMVFGWGEFGGRNRVFHPETGQDRSITDGFWIIIFGARGVVGWLAAFGLLLWPVVTAWRRLHRIEDANDRRLVAGLSVICAIQAVDLLPNGLFSYLPLVLAGALMGAVQGMTRPRKSARPGAPAAT